MLKGEWETGAARYLQPERTIRGVTSSQMDGAALPQHMAESLRLSGGVLILAEAAPQLEAEPPKQ